MSKTCQQPGCSAKIVIKSKHGNPRFCPVCKLARKKQQDKQFRIDNPDYMKKYHKEWKAALKKQEENFYKTLSRKANMVTTTTEKPKYPAEVVQPIADAVVEQIMHHCDRIEIAGSLRRGKSEVGDIEIICIPKKIIVTDDLFTSHSENCMGFVQAVDQFQKIKGDARLGKYMQRIYPPPLEIRIDIFTAEPDTWGYILMLRTGPADFSRGMVVELRKHGLIGENGAIYNQANKKRVPCPDEETFFNLVKIKYIHPKWRI